MATGGASMKQVYDVRKLDVVQSAEAGKYVLNPFAWLGLNVPWYVGLIVLAIAILLIAAYVM